MKVKIKKLNAYSKLPTKGHPTDGGWDLYAADIKQFKDHFVVDFGLGFEIPEGYMLHVVPRSSLSGTGWILSNSVGVIDSSYRGSVKAVFRPLVIDVHNKVLPLGKMRSEIYVKEFPYKIGDRTAQCYLMPVLPVEWEEVETLSETARGEGGFGSTGK